MTNLQAPINVPFAPSDLDALYALLMRHPQAIPFENLERIVYTIRSAASDTQPKVGDAMPLPDIQTAAAAPE